MSPQLKGDQSEREVEKEPCKLWEETRSAKLTMSYRHYMLSSVSLYVLGEAQGKNSLPLLAIPKSQMHRPYCSRLLLEKHSSSLLHAVEGLVSAFSEPWV